MQRASLDADGYITITERGEPRAGFIATGERGRMHCEELHKHIGAGVLQPRPKGVLMIIRGVNIVLVSMPRMI